MSLTVPVPVIYNPVRDKNDFLGTRCDEYSLFWFSDGQPLVLPSQAPSALPLPVFRT
jgi:hypothetical protein